MIIEKTLTTANGATTTIHKLWNIELIDNALYAIVDSFIDSNSTAIAWRDRYSLPAITLASNPELEILTMLIQTPGPFYQGTLV